MSRRRRRWMPILRRKDRQRLSNRQAALLTVAMMAVIVAVPIVMMIRFNTSQDRNAWPFSVPWDSQWPSLPVVSAAGALTDELAQKVYALVGRHGDTLQYMPCYCGCRSEGHQSVMQCYIKRRTPDGQIVEWHPHGRICPMGADIAGDAVLWHQHGTPLEQVRADIEREYSSRGPATATPPVPVN